MAKQQGLGRGLSALFSEFDDSGEEKNAFSPTPGVATVEIKKIKRNLSQPRKTFEDEGLEELAESIKKHGILQPLLLKPEGEFYMVVAGERRLRAALKAGLTEVPAVIKDFEDRQLLEAALTENIQRENLTDIECAVAYKELADSFGLSQEEIARSMGKSRSYVANTMRLLTLPKDVQRLIGEKKLSAGHARAVLSLENESLRSEFAVYIIENSLSVREAEALSKTYGVQKKTEKNGKKENKVKSSDLLRLEEDLSRALGTKTSLIEQGKKGGYLKIEYYSNDDLERIMGIITSENK